MHELRQEDGVAALACLHWNERGCCQGQKGKKGEGVTVEGSGVGVMRYVELKNPFEML
jgi:hypothetical protein